MLEQWTSASSGGDTVVIITSVASMLFFGFLATRVTKLLRLPNVTAYIVTGILMGPFCFRLIPKEVIGGMDFLSDIALAFIAFSTGEFFRLDILKKNGFKVLIITFFEALPPSILVFSVVYFILHIDLGFSIVLAALASATASASTMMTIRQTRAKGDFVDTLLQVVGLDNILSLLLYSTAISIALSFMAGSDGLNLVNVIKPILINIGVLILGGIFGVFLKLLMPKKRSTDNRLIIVVSLLFAFCSICAMLNVSPLLGCMSMSTVYVNITDDERLYKQINYFSPPFLLLFFVHSGLSFNLSALMDNNSAVGSVPLLVISITYFVVRIIGKYGGAFAGCHIMGKPPEVRNYLGLALIPQAGVAIGLAALGARELGGESGMALNTIILSSSILYELIGPACGKLALYLSHSYSNELEDIVSITETKEDGEMKTAAEQLIERLQKITEQLKAEENTPSEEEQAFTEAAEEFYGYGGYDPNQQKFGPKFRRH